MSSAVEKCAVCGKPVQPAFTPFCSKRCADVDLGRWLKGSYSIPGSPAEDGGQTQNKTEDPPEE